MTMILFFQCVLLIIILASCFQCVSYLHIHDAYPLDPSVLVLQNRHKSHLVDTKQVCILLIINYYYEL